MANWFNDLSIKWKLALISAATTAVALIATGTIMVAIEAKSYEARKIDQFTAQAQIVAASVVGALVFNDSTTASTSLGALAANPEIDAAAAYDSDGNLVAHYGSQTTRANTVPEKAPSLEAHLQREKISVAVPVIQDKTNVGTLYLAGHIVSTQERFTRQLEILLAIGFAGLCVVLPISMRLHRAITNPIEELAAKNAIIEATLESVDHGILVADKDMQITYINDRVTESLGLTANDLKIGLNFETLLKDQQEQASSTYADLAQQTLDILRSSQRERLEHVLPNGHTVEYRQSPLPGGGFVRTYTDVTEERAFQQNLQAAKARAEEADIAKSQFLAAMSHEIRTPMNGVIGLVELLYSTSLSSEQRQMVEIIRQSGITLLDVINDILDYSKIEAGRMTIESTEFALGEIIETTTTAISGHTKSKTLNITCTIDPQIDWVVRGDPVRMRQIILNLMGNALKFTEVGSIEIEATVDTVTNDMLNVLFEVRDTGIGIAEEKTTRLFERFSQADYSTTRRFGGTGLGLSISKNLVELMDGEIGVRSVLGKGSTFWFKIPFARVPEANRENPFEKCRKDLAGLRVLVCDRIAHKTAVTTYLRAIGVVVVEAKSVTEAIECLYREDAADRKVDLAILTVHLGEDSASLFAAELKKRKGLEQTKVLLVLPNLSASAARHSAKTEFVTSISSPVSRSALYNAVASLAGRVMPDVSARENGSQLDFIAPSKDEAIARGCLILVAEDNETNYFVIKSQMQRLGFATEFVSDGREAWQVLKADNHHYGLLLTDCHMPFLDGYQLTGAIREREFNSQHRLPIVALTANALEGESEICLAAGMDDYLSKPASLSDLDRMVRKWLPAAGGLRKPRKPVLAGPADTVPNSSSHDHVDALQAPSSPPIDMAGLGSLLGNDDPIFLREMLTMFWSTMADTPARMHELEVAGDAKALSSVAHAAKGAAASACAEELAALCKTLEGAALDENWETVTDVLPQIDMAFEKVQKFIEKETFADAMG